MIERLNIDPKKRTNKSIYQISSSSFFRWLGAGTSFGLLEDGIDGFAIYSGIESIEAVQVTYLFIFLSKLLLKLIDLSLICVFIFLLAVL